jgi:hypothetical protein
VHEEAFASVYGEGFRLSVFRSRIDDMSSMSR